MQAKQIIKPVLDALNEDVADPVRWTCEDLLGFVTDGMYQIVLLRPDANAVVEAVPLTGGSKQTLPAQGTQLLGVVRNMGADGRTPGRAVSLVERPALDAVNMMWHMDAPCSEIDHYAYNEKVPTVFWVCPVPEEGVWVELEYGVVPSALTGLDDETDLGDIWKGPLMDYVFHRCYGVNASSPADLMKSKEYLSRFYLSLGEEAKARLVFNPNAEQGSAS